MAGSQKYRPGNDTKQNPFGTISTASGQNNPKPGGVAGAGKARPTSKVAQAVLSKQTRSGRGTVR